MCKVKDFVKVAVHPELVEGCWGCRVTGIPTATLASIKKYIVEQLLARGFKKTEIAKRLGISRMAVHNILSG